MWPEVHGAHRAYGFIEKEGTMREHVWPAGRYVDLIMDVPREE